MSACERHLTGRVVLEVETEASGQVRDARILASELRNAPALGLTGEPS